MVDGQERVVAMQVNTAQVAQHPSTPKHPQQGADPRLAGWVKVEGGAVVPPPPATIERGLHITTRSQHSKLSTY